MDKIKENSIRQLKRKQSFKDLMKTGKVKGKKLAKRNSVSSEDELDEFFIWEKYLERCHAKAVPKSAFKHVTDAKSSGFERGMKVEARDQTSSSESYWVATVVMVSGPLLLLRFDGYDDDRSGDFWLNSSGDLLHPIGWCAKTHNVLIPPATIRHKKSNWAKFLVENLRAAVAAPDLLFLNNNDDIDNGLLKAGTTVEIQDDKDPLCYWTATVIEKYGLRLRLRFVGYEEEDHDIWEYYFADCLHSIGWGKEMGMTLLPPKVLDKYNRWSLYSKFVVMCLNQCRQLSKNNLIPKHSGLEVGLKLEAVNPEAPDTICVGTVREILSDLFFIVEIDCVVNFNPRIKFMCHAKSKYLYPIGWCEKNNVKITPPKGFSTTSSFKLHTYLDLLQAKAAPESLFDKDNIKWTAKEDLFKSGQRVEVLNELNPSYYWIADVTSQTIVHKYHLELKGAGMCDVNVYVHSDAVKPLGWCKNMGLRLKPSKALNKEWKEEINLLEDLFKAEDSASSPLQKLDKVDDLPTPHGFEPGMQLEAVNPRDPSSICVASVIQSNSAHYFTVQIDTAMETIDEDKIRFWCLSSSRKIFPTGWCKSNNVQLTPPPGYPDTEFVWEIYMKVKQTKPASESLFNMTSPSSDLEIGLKLEAADQTNPGTISVATSTQIVGGTVWVRLDGYQTSPVEQIYDIQSYHLFPVGWCSMHGHPLLAPQQKKKESETRRWAASLRKRMPDTSPADSSTKQTTKRLKKDKNSTINSQKSIDKTKKYQKTIKSKDDSINSTTKENSDITPIQPVTSGVATPSSSTGDDGSSPQRCPNAVSSDTDTASESCSPTPTTTIDLTNDYSREGDKELILFIKSTCSCGPYIDKKKLVNCPNILGPGPPNKVLKQVVEQVVLSAYSGAKVLDLLSTEKEKQSFLSILKTLSSKLLICENLFSLNKVNTCSKCDKVDTYTTDKTKTLAKPAAPTFAKPSSTTMALPNSVTVALPNSTNAVALPNSTTVALPNITTVALPNITTVALPNITTVALPNITTVALPNITTVALPNSTTVALPIITTVALPNSTTVALPNSTTKLNTPTISNNIKPTNINNTTINNNNIKTPVKPALQSPTLLIHSNQSSSPVVLHDDEVVGKIPERYISTWSISEVVEFVTPRGCKNFASFFQEQEVDGKALMLLSLDDIHKVLGVTLGPAIKLHDDVQKLRARNK